MPGDDPDTVLSNFRNDYHPRIAVTVDMIATGTDVKPLEVLLFMRDVRSRGYYEQMKGRGVRSLDYESLKKVSGSADSAKTRFVLIDAVGVEKSLKTESRPLEKKPGASLEQLLKSIAVGGRDEDTVLSLGNRLHGGLRLGLGLRDLARGLIEAVDTDRVVADALDAAKAAGITRSEDTLTPGELDAAREQRIAAACQPFDDPALRNMLETARREHEQLIDHLNLDQVTFSGFGAQAEAKAQATVQAFADYLSEHKDEIAALGFFYAQPYQRRPLTFAMIEDLHEALSRPPLMLTTERLWSAYARVQASKVKSADTRRQLTDLVALVRFALGMDDELKPFADSVDKRFQAWIFRHTAQRATSFTPEQTEWLRLIKDHIASSCAISREDFDY
ncbi:MAG: restriction endonuclease subunit R, partial [Xanthomonadaceae bacterium]|nr:restriction endonuclease subunit R [Xanthomonadaceae bacterium]